MGANARSGPVHACSTAHGRRAIETVHILRPDLDSEAELKVIDDIEAADDEGVSVLPGCWNCWPRCPRTAGRW